MAHWTTDQYDVSQMPVRCEGSFTGEDPILRALLPDDPVVYVDVGAAHPVCCSNTWQFYKAGGRGLLIEPQTIFWPAILRRRPRDHLWPTAVGDRHEVKSWRSASSCSTFCDDWDIGESQPGRVEMVPLQYALAELPHIRDAATFLDVDANGYEGQVLAGNDWDAFRPEVVCVKYVKHSPGVPHPKPTMNHLWEHILFANGYQEHKRTAGNIIYVRE